MHAVWKWLGKIVIYIVTASFQWPGINLTLTFDPMAPKSKGLLLSSSINYIWSLKVIGQQEAQRATYRAPEYNVPPFWGIGQGGHFFLLIGPKKHKLGRGCWDLASCQVSLNSVQRFQRSRKCFSQSETRAAILFFRSARKTQTWKRILISCFLSSFVEFRSAVSEEKSKMSQPIRGQGGHLVFPIGPKNTNLVEDVKILLPVKFGWIPFSSIRGEVENVKS